MTFPRYPEYKDSGVEWMGNVPAHWKSSALKHLASYQNGFPFKPEDRSEAGLPIIRISQLTGEEEPNYFSGEVDGRNFVRNGDLLFSWSATIDSFIWDRGDAWLNQHIFKVSVSEETTKEYLYYLIKFIAPKLADVDAHGSTMRHIKKESLSQKVEIPPISEQAAIARFLDVELGQVDRLIAEQEKLIDLLKEKRQAVISHAVTKGLDPNVPMKDSGIEWLGAIPAHWKMKRLKNISPFITVGVVVNPSSYVADEGLPFIYGGDISEGKITIEGARRISPMDSERNSKTKLSAGDLLTVRVGAPGVTAVVPPECEGGNCASVMLVRKGDFDSRWLCYAMNSRMVRFQVEVVQYGAAQEQFNIGHAINFWIAAPPRAEQALLADYVDRITGEFGELVAEAGRGIDLLRERRSALISAAVTGKIDVRKINAMEAA